MSDISGINELLVDLTTAPLKVHAGARAVIQKGCANIKADWRQRTTGLAHAPLYPRSITYDTGFVRGGWEGEVGPDKALPQGALGNLITYGSVHNPPTGDDIKVAAAEAPKFERAIAALAAEALS